MFNFIIWGTQNEAEALKQFSTITSLAVEPTGLWLNSSVILGASPDGPVGNDGIIKVKYQYKIRDCFISQSITND